MTPANKCLGSNKEKILLHHYWSISYFSLNQSWWNMGNLEVIKWNFNYCKITIYSCRRGLFQNVPLKQIILRTQRNLKTFNIPLLENPIEQLKFPFNFARPIIFLFFQSIRTLRKVLIDLLVTLEKRYTSIKNMRFGRI